LNEGKVIGLRVFDLIEDGDIDTDNARSAIYRIVCLKTGRPVPAATGAVSLDPTTRDRMYREYDRLVAETAALVDQCWPAIRRVAKRLERHDDVGQVELDRLIDIGMRIFVS
jgi:hypothetical protein